VLNYTNLDFSKPGEALDAIVRGWQSGEMPRSSAPGRSSHATGRRTPGVERTAQRYGRRCAESGDHHQRGAWRSAINSLRAASSQPLRQRPHIAGTRADLRQAKLRNELNQPSSQPERATLEGQRLAIILRIRIKPLIQLCVAEQSAASHCSPAVGAMESCHHFSDLPAPDDRASLEAASHG
jgi:hypothetical protein